MSKITKNIPNTSFQITFGFDRTSAFVQIFDLSKDPKTNGFCVLDINNCGINHRNELNDIQEQIITEFKKRFANAKRKDNLYPNLSENDILLIAKIFGMPIDLDFRSLVYNMLD